MSWTFLDAAGPFTNSAKSERAREKTEERRDSSRIRDVR